MRKTVTGILVAAMLLFAAGCKLVVTPAQPNGWGFLNEGTNGSGYFVNGPGVPPAGRGSALLTIDGTGREAIATTRYAGQSLAAINQLRYSTYQAFSGSPNETLYLQFDVDYDSTDSSTAYQGRFVFVRRRVAPSCPSSGRRGTPRVATCRGTRRASGASAFRPIVGDACRRTRRARRRRSAAGRRCSSDYPNARIRPSDRGVHGPRRWPGHGRLRRCDRQRDHRLRQHGGREQLRTR